DPRLGTVAPLDEGQVVTLDLEQGQVRSIVTPDDPRGIFLAVGGDDGDAVDGAGAGQALDQVIVGDDIAVGRNDEARAERAGFAGPRLLAGRGRATAAAAVGRGRAAEAAEEFLERIGLGAHRDALLG